MIAPLRRRHRWLAPVCFLAAASGLALGVMARPAAFIAEGSGGSSGLKAPPSVEAAAQWVAEGVGLRAAVVQDPAGPGAALWILADERLEASDVLAYVGAEVAVDTVPSDARLVGSVAPHGATRLPMPDSERAILTLFSLGQQRVLGSAKLDPAIVGGR